MISSVESDATKYESAENVETNRLPVRWWTAAAISAFALVLITTFVLRPDQALTEQQSSSLVVGLMPLEVVGDDPDLQGLAVVIEFDLAAEIDKTPLSVRTHIDDQLAPYQVESKLARSAEQIAWTLQLIRAVDSNLLWSDRRLIPVSDPEGAIRRHAQYFAYMIRVAAGLDSGVDGTSQDARQSYIEGVKEFALLAQGGGGDWWAAERYLLDAIAAEPDFVHAYNQLGILYKNRMGFQWTYSQAIDPTIDMVNKVVSKSNWTHLVGTINTQLELDFEAAVANFESVNASDECCGTAGEVEGEIGAALLWSGDLEGAQVRFNAAKRLDPGTNRFIVGMGEALVKLASNDYRGALKLLDESRVWLGGTATTNANAHLTRIRALFWSGKRAEAEKELDAALAIYGDTLPELFVGPIALLGREAEARALLDEFEQRFSEGKLTVNSGSFWAAFHLGELDWAFEWLERVIENREFWFLPMFRHSEVLHPIRQDPRFVKVMTRLDDIEANGTAIATAAYP